MSDSKRYAIKRRGDEKEGGGHFWDDTGMTLIAKLVDGQPRYYIKDGRTGELYSAFRIESRRQQAPQSEAVGQHNLPPAQPQQGVNPNDDIPF